MDKEGKVLYFEI